MQAFRPKPSQCVHIAGQLEIGQQGRTKLHGKDSSPIPAVAIPLLGIESMKELTIQRRPQAGLGTLGTARRTVDGVWMEKHESYAPPNNN
jgi:hypothetical protein